MRYTPTDITSTYAAIAALNSNFDEIQALIEKCLFTDGTAPNQMEAVLDMNHFNVQNLAAPINDNDAVRLIDLTNLLLNNTNLSTAIAKVDTRAQVAALTLPSAHFSVLLTEAGREGILVFNNSNLSTQVAADTAQGIYVAPASDPTGASGAWVRLFNGPVNPKWFGLVAGDVSGNGTANSAAMLNMFTTCAATNNLHILLTPEVFWFGSTIDINIGNVIFEGSVGAGIGDNTSTTLKFPSGTTGIRVQNEQSSGATTKDASTHSSGGDSIIRNLCLVGSFTTTEAEAHGIQLRRRATLESITIKNFEGDGVYISADLGAASGATPPYGNNSCGYLTRIGINNCRNGIVFDGPDSNANSVFGCNIIACRQWGIFDSSVLGNSYHGGQLDANGSTAWNNGTAGQPASTVSSGGNIYGVIAGQEVGASTNAPSGTTADNTWWYYIQAGAPSNGFPAWFSGMAVRSGGAVRSSSLVSRSVFSGLHAENDQAKAQIAEPAFVVGGILANWCYDNPAIGTGGGGSRIRTGLERSNTSPSAIIEPMLSIPSGNVTVALGGGSGNTSNRILDMVHSSITGTYQLAFSTGLGNILLSRNDGTGTSFQVTTASTSSFFGTGAQVLDAFNPLCLIVTDNGKSFSNGRRLMIDTAAPASGAHGQGEWQLDRSASTTIIGNKCTTAGTPGTWSPIFGLTAAPAAIATSGSGADLTASSVTFAKFQTVAANSLVGNPTGSTATVQAITLAGGLAFSGTTLTAAGALTPTSVVSSGAITSSSASAGIGYSTGAGGTVTQITSRTTGVTLNKTCGAITLVSAAGSATWTTFTVTNSSVGANDVIDICQKSGANLYSAVVTAVAAGSFNVSISAVSGTATESPVFNFVVTKSVTA